MMEFILFSEPSSPKADYRRPGLCRAALLKAFVSTSFVDSHFQGIEMAVLKIFSEGLSLVWKIFIRHQIILSSFKRRREK